MDPRCNDAYYLIDDEYHVLQFSSPMLQYCRDLRLGDLCYRVFCGYEEPCASCPIYRTGGRALVRSKRSGWLEVEALRIDWPQHGPANLLLPRPAAPDAAARANLEIAQEVDSLTGLFREEAFLRRAAERLRTAEGRWCMLASDIDHFKLYNQWYGTEGGDRFLRAYAQVVLSLEQDYGALGGYFGDDDFVLLLPYDKEVLLDAQRRLNQCVRRFSEDVGFAPAFGVYAISDSMLPVRTMYDYARVALSNVKGNYAQRFCLYDAAMIQRIEENHMILSEVQHGIANDEFCTYVQPQVNMLTGKIVGMEALVRWRHPTRGIISPGVFIPVLEQNGLISKLDTYLWDHVAHGLRQSLDWNHPPLPISVNVSRMDIYSVDVVGFFENLLRKYDLPAHLIEVEITESAYAEDFERFTQVVNGLHKLGIRILMDDFGSGYSSLNMLREVHVDIIKLDMKFLQMNNGSMGRGIGILESVVSMAHALGISLIAEGVETADHKRMLLDMNCQYGQGYYFYRPMPVTEAIKLLTQKDILDHRGISSQRIRRMDIQQLLRDRDVGNYILNSLLGATALYRLNGDTLRVEEVNDPYYSVTGSDLADCAPLRENALLHVPDPDERAALLAAAQRACVEVASGASFSFHRMTSAGTAEHLHIRFYFLCHQGEDDILFASLTRLDDRCGKGCREAEGPAMGCPPSALPGQSAAAESGDEAARPSLPQAAIEVLHDETMARLPLDIVLLTFEKEHPTPRFEVLHNGLHRSMVCGGDNAGEQHFLQNGQYRNCLSESVRLRLVEQMSRALQAGDAVNTEFTFQCSCAKRAYRIHLQLTPCRGSSDAPRYLCLCSEAPPPKQELTDPAPTT